TTRADVARGSRSPRGNSRARICSRIHPFVGALVAGHVADTRNHVRELRTPIDGARARAAWVAAIEVRRHERTALQQEDIGKLPATENRIDGSAPVLAEHAIAAEGKIVERGGDPAMPAGAEHFAIVEMAIVEIGCARSSVFVCEALL